MMGDRKVDQAALFYEFSLDGHVPADHMLRAIDRFVDLEGLRAHVAPFYSPIGRPSIDPELLIRMLLVGYCFGIRSERRLCEEVHLNLAYRWFCRLGLDGDVPDHSTFSKNRHGRFRDCDLLRELFETVVRRCMAEGLVGGEGFAVDASLIKADANRQRCVPGDEGLPPGSASRAINEYLAVLDDAAFGGASPVVPKFISPADPASRWTGANKGLAFFAYSTNYLIDLDHAVIVDVEATTAIRQAEVGAARTMIERVKERYDLWPARLAADTAYGSTRGSSPTSPLSTSPDARTGPSRAATSPSTAPGISTPAQRAKPSDQDSAHTRRRATPHWTIPSATAPLRRTATSVQSSPAARPTRRPAK
jgi:transposase